MPDWRADVLRGLGAPITQQNLAFLSSWQRWEGGHTNNDAQFNWLNTTRNAPGAVRSINSVGVKAFDSYRHGIGATIDTLKNGRYGGIVKSLMSGNPQATPGVVGGLSTWVSGQPDSASGRRYAERVLGAPAPAKTPMSNIKEKASTAFHSGPAGIAYGPNPFQFRALTAASLLNASRQTIQGNVLQGTGEALTNLIGLRGQYAAASQAARNVALDAAQDGGEVDTNAPPSRSTPEIEGVPDQIRQAIDIAEQQVGKPYVWGAESPAEGGFDCSGLLDYAFKRAGFKIPGRLTTYTARNLGVSVKGQPMRPGDWLITNGGEHMVMYVGNGRVIAAPYTGTVVQYQPVSRFEGDIVDVRRLG